MFFTLICGEIHPPRCPIGFLVNLAELQASFASEMQMRTEKMLQQG